MLIIDDLAIGRIEKHLGPALLELIGQQSMNGALLLTSQFPREKWYDLFDDPTITNAIQDRIIRIGTNIHESGGKLPWSNLVRALRG